MNATIEKFGYPATLIAEWEHWLLLLRPAQPTIGSLILAARGDATAFGDLPDGAHAELKPITAAIEHALGTAVSPDRINYLMLMMVDPHVHFHVLPRYDGSRSLTGLTIHDEGWPAIPQLGEARLLDDGERDALIAALKPLFGR